MQRIGGLGDVPVHPVLGMENPWVYRNKAQVPIGEREGGLVAGFYRQERMISLYGIMLNSGRRKRYINSRSKTYL